MEFIKYSSIENSYRDQFLDKIRQEGKDGGEWVVTEKVHGAQFTIYYDGAQFRVSSRTAFLEETDDFYNWQIILADNKECVKKLYDMLKIEGSEMHQVSVYGELFGGSYPHPDVPKIKEAKRLQKGVYYHPGNLFYAFDIRVDGQYLTVDETTPLFETSGLFYARTLLRGSLEECIQYPNDFISKISQWLDLPQIPDNIAEGVVIKPVQPRFLRVGDRVILKSKNEKFKERKTKKNRQHFPDEKPLSDEAKDLQEEIEALVTENRLDNVLSKQPEMPYPLPENYFGQIMKAFAADVHEDFNKDFAQRMEQLEKKEQKVITKALNQAAAQLVRKKLFSNAG